MHILTLFYVIPWIATNSAPYDRTFIIMLSIVSLRVFVRTPLSECLRDPK